MIASGIRIFSVFSEPPLSTVKPTKRAWSTAKQRGMHKYHIANIQTYISFKTNEKFDLVAVSHKLIHISPSNKLICLSNYLPISHNTEVNHNVCHRVNCKFTLIITIKL